MAELYEKFEAIQADGPTLREPVPSGRYVVVMTDSEFRITRDGEGEYLWCEFTIVEGEFAGRRLHDRFNMINKSAIAIEIGKRKLSSVCHAVGKTRISDSEELHGIPLLAGVRIRPADERYDQPSNEIRFYEAISPSPWGKNSTK